MGSVTGGDGSLTVGGGEVVNVGGGPGRKNK